MRAAAIIPTLFLSSLAFSSAVLAECSIDKSPKKLSLDEVNSYYECAREELVKGYQSGDNELAKKYTSWKAGATGPGKVPGIHASRYLMTYINDIGHSTYVAYAPSGVNFPVGTIVAKESFKIKKGGKLKAGPLFLMEKVGLEKAPKADGWFYSVVNADGGDKKISQAFCHGCHQVYKAQDAMGYPVEAVRIKN